MKRLVAGITAFLVLLAIPANSVSSDAVCSPAIEDVSPTSVFVGETVTLRGSCLVADTAERNSPLSVEGLPLVVLSARSNEITAMVTARPPSGTVALAILGGEASSELEVKNWVEPSADDFHPGIIEVKLAPNATIGDVLAPVGAREPEQIFASWIERFPELAVWWRLRVDGDTIEHVRQMAALPDVEWAQPEIENRMRMDSGPDPCFASPTDTECDVAISSYLGRSWGADGQWGVQQISAEGAWATETGDSSVRIAILDTGVEDHEDLEFANGSSRVVVRRDFTGQGLTPAFSHATMVAGVAAATLNNGAGIAGVAPGVSLVSYKVHFPCPGAPAASCLVDEWYDALLYAASIDQVKVANLSFGGNEVHNGLEQAVIEVAFNAGIVVVTTAGNSCENLNLVPNYPASYHHVITVAATNKEDSRAHWQYFGEGQPMLCSTQPQSPRGSGVGGVVDISAPGFDILTTNWSQSAAGACGNHPYCSTDGTSFAAPMVSGAAALLASQGFYPCEIVETLTGRDQFGDPISADPITPDPEIGILGMGVGRLNVDKALDWWAGGLKISDTSWPDGAVFHVEGDTQRYVINGDVKDPVSTGQYNERNDQCIPHAIFDGGAYVQGLFDCIPTASETWPIPDDDADCDGFRNTTSGVNHAPETYIGTSPAKHCASTAAQNDEPTPDAWPVDFDDNKIVNGADAGKFAPAYGHTVAEGPFGSPPLPGVRFDFTGNGVINGSDVGRFGTFYNKACT